MRFPALYAVLYPGIRPVCVRTQGQLQISPVGSLYLQQTRNTRTLFYTAATSRDLFLEISTANTVWFYGLMGSGQLLWRLSEGGTRLAKTFHTPEKDLTRAYIKQMFLD
jgi:hypothetical protein